MWHDFPPRPLILIVGATAVGKSELSMQLAEAIGGEIISADSRSFYRGMDIGTAKPAAADIQRIPHHLVNIAYPDETISLSQFLALARDCIDEIHGREKVPFLVGGTGQYVRAILEGWELPEGEPDLMMRSVLENIAQEYGAIRFHHGLRFIDPEAARSIDASNIRRVIRAYEVIFTTGKKFSAQRIRTQCPYSTLTIGLTRIRSEIYSRADQRIESMIETGLEMETRDLLSRGYSVELPSMSAIGYKEMAKVVNGEITTNEAALLMKKRTRTFIRRQHAWFQPDDPDIHWFSPGSESIHEIARLIQRRDSWKIAVDK